MNLLSAAAAAFAATLVFGFSARWLGPRVGAMDVPGPLKGHGIPISYTGGLALAGGMAVGAAAHRPHLQLGVAVALVGVMILGLFDDRRHLAPAWRFGGELALGIVCSLGFGFVDPPGGLLLGTALAAIIFVVAVNAVNVVDGTDGLAAGIGALSALGLGAVASRTDHQADIPVLLAAAALGFLWHNRPKAKLFLGDNGAYLMGGTLAVSYLRSGNDLSLILAGTMCLGFFLLDLGLAVLRRLTGRRMLSAGDRMHLYDQLADRGFSTWQVLLICLAIQAVFSAAGIGIVGLDTEGAVLAFTATWLVAIALLFAGRFVRMDHAGHNKDFS